MKLLILPKVGGFPKLVSKKVLKNSSKKSLEWQDRQPH